MDAPESRSALATSFCPNGPSNMICLVIISVGWMAAVAWLAQTLSAIDSVGAVASTGPEEIA